MFRLRTNLTDPVTFSFEGRRLTASRGDTLAAALLASGVFIFRNSPVSSAPRAPFCMIGNCYECFVQVEAMGVVQACLTEVTEGMQITKVSNQIDELGMDIKEVSKE
ncbi:MAG: (2Fe-2S)-binding protein [Proteobacteria bacterium]|nr:(2Fe-2S)-binding protein [Pseudomonadota bacterium]MBT4106678.1 (2Fe-2S)-binding protein [Pseudomonadota bacterium]MBT4357990.1 (2Fe-2S)-binding protein [Pseudomonadota bacterium]MBT4986554.1 (2Fe-2S)-binding protein [Pseudomonadota bacterium]MBT5189454.1 (2Fe-2S)-binding protein [Pseudomonadota bacterium]